MPTRFSVAFFILISFMSFCQGFAQNGAAQGKAPQTTPRGVHIDFARYFFVSPEAERSSRAILYTQLNALQTLKGRITQSGELLLHALELRDQISEGFVKHEAYLHLRHALDARDTQAREDESRLDSDFNQQTAFLENELLSLPPEQVQRFEAVTPGLAKFQFAIDKIRRAGEHTLPLREEELLRGLSPELTDWQAALYDELQTQTKFEPVIVNGQTFDPQRDRRKLASSLDARVRQESFTKRYAGFERVAPLYAFALSRLATANNRLATLHHFESAPEQFYWRSFLSRREVDQMLSTVAAHADIYKNYERVRSEHVGRALGLKPANLWDLDAVTIASEPQFTFEEMRAILARALAPLGDEYVHEMNALLDPANGRADVAHGADRKRTGFSEGFSGFTSVFFAGDFTGSYNDMRVIAHEGGHAVHRELMTKAGVIPAYAEGPHFLFESFAVLNELLLADYLSAEAKDPELKAWYLEQFLQGKGTVAFVAGAEAELEQRIYTEAQRGKLLSADFLDQITKSIYTRYSLYGDSVTELRHQWMLVPLMYEDPFYDLNYVYAGVLGLKYFEMLQKDPGGFRHNYIALLRNGFDAPPRELLKKYLAIDLDDPALVDGAMKLVKARMGKLTDLYNEQNAQGSR